MIILRNITEEEKYKFFKQVLQKCGNNICFYFQIYLILTDSALMMGYDIKLYSRYDIKEKFFWQFIKEKHYQRDCRLSLQ